MMDINVQDNQASLLPLLQRSLGWEYFDGSHSKPCCHPETPWRLLPFLVIVCPEKGQYVSRVEGDGVVKIHANEALLIPGGMRNTVAMPQPGVVNYAHIRYTVFGSMDLFHFFDIPRRVTGRAGADIGRLTHDLHEAMTTSPAREHIFQQAVIRQDLASRLLRSIVSASIPRVGDSGDLQEIIRMEPVLEYIEKNLAKPISRPELAELVFLSETRFHYVFKKALGIAPMEYVMHTRMKKAQALLAQTELNVTEIGERVGIPDIFHFSKTFKATFSLSPLAYRKKLAESLSR